MRDKKLQRRQVAHSRFGGFDRGQVASAADTGWATAGMCMVTRPAEKLVAVSEFGEVLTYVGGTRTAETIEPRPQCLRNAATVGGYAYACGMGWQVYRRGQEGRWTALPVPEPSGSLGFEAIGGLDESRIYAVGWEGEIWCWTDGAWHRARRDKVPGRRRDLILTGVTVGPDGAGYACGQQGTLLRGDGDVWEFVDTCGITDDFWDLSSPTSPCLEPNPAGAALLREIVRQRERCR
jgi:hypothetical protein